MGVRRFFLAVSNERMDALEELLKHGADPTIPDKAGRTPLQAAIDSGKSAFKNKVIAAVARWQKAHPSRGQEAIPGRTDVGPSRGGGAGGRAGAMTAEERVAENREEAEPLREFTVDALEKIYTKYADRIHKESKGNPPSAELLNELLKKEGIKEMKLVNFEEGQVEGPSHTPHVGNKTGQRHK